MSVRSSASSVQHAPPPQFTYKVTVRTGTAANAGTSSRASITFQGSKGKLRRRRLAKNSKDAFSFLPGKNAVFRVRGKDVGELTHVTSECKRVWLRVWLVTPTFSLQLRVRV